MSVDPAARPLTPARRPATPPRTARVLPAPAPSAAATAAHAHSAPRFTGWTWALAAVVAAGHVVANAVSPYGIHRDELLYLAMGEHLRFWAMDFPPFIAVLAQFTRAVAGDQRVVESVAVLRLAPALAAAVLVLLAAVLARDLGGRRGPQLLAAGAVAASPLFLRAGSLFQPVVFDQLWWTLGFVALVRLGRASDAVRASDDAAPAPPRGAAFDVTPRAADPRSRRRRVGAVRHWLLLGAAIGVGLLTKFSIAFFAAGALVGVLATPLRRALRTPAPWGAAALALAVGAPSVVGQVRLGWPVAGQLVDLQATQLARVGPAEFLGGQLLLGPAVLLAAAGLVALLAAPPTAASLRAGRAAGVAALVAILLLLAARGKAYYAGPVYPLLWAAGAVALGTRRWSTRPDALRARGWSRARLAGAGALIGLYGAATLPFGLPVLPPDPMARYAAAAGIGTGTNTGGRLALPQDYADMLGWPELVAATAAAWQQIPADARIGAALLAGNYGQAGALTLYGPRLGLPPVVSAAGSFWFFGPGERAGDPILAVGVPPAELAPLCTALHPMGVVRHERTRWLVDEERDVPITLCVAPRRTLHELWPSLAGRN